VNDIRSSSQARVDVTGLGFYFCPQIERLTPEYAQYCDPT
jgi:hypothetical protein